MYNEGIPKTNGLKKVKKIKNLFAKAELDALLALV